MTWIVDESGRRWVDAPQRKQRKTARALRFANLKVGDQIVKTYTTKGWRGGKDDFKGPPVDLNRSTWHYVVTDLWFDPVAGEANAIAGQMVAIKRIYYNGEIVGHKERHTLRGLASNGFKYADRDYITFCKGLMEAIKTENVVGIGRGVMLKHRPKVPGHHL